MSLHHRSHERLYDYWDSLRKGRPYPQESDIDADALDDIWPSCFLISIDDVTRRVGYRYSYLGSDLIEAYGDDVSSPDFTLRQLADGTSPMVAKLDEMVKDRQPLIDEAEFMNLQHLLIKYRACILPLGKDGELSHIIGCMRWKAY